MRNYTIVSLHPTTALHQQRAWLRAEQPAAAWASGGPRDAGDIAGSEQTMASIRPATREASRTARNKDQSHLMADCASVNSHRVRSSLIWHCLHFLGRNTFLGTEHFRGSPAVLWEHAVTAGIEMPVEPACNDRRCLNWNL